MRDDDEQDEGPRVSFKFRNGVQVRRINSRTGKSERMNEDGSVKGSGVGKLVSVLVLVLVGLVVAMFFTTPVTPLTPNGPGWEALAFVGLLAFLAFSFSKRDRPAPQRTPQVEQFGRDLDKAGLVVVPIFIIVLLLIVATNVTGHNYVMDGFTAVGIQPNVSPVWPPEGR